MKRFPLAVLLSVLAVALIAALAIASSRSEGGEIADGNADPEPINVETQLPAPVVVDTEAEGTAGSSDYPSEGAVTDRAGDDQRPVREGAQEAETLDDLAPGDPTSVEPSDKISAPDRQQ